MIVIIWIVPTLVFAGVILLIDFIVRLKKWSQNTKTEKIGLVLTVAASFPYIFCSIYGLLFGIVGAQGTSAVMIALHNIVELCAKGMALVSAVAVIASLVLRARGKAAASNWSLGVGLIYCTVITVVSFFV